MRVSSDYLNEMRTDTPLDDRTVEDLLAGRAHAHTDLAPLSGALAELRSVARDEAPRPTAALACIMEAGLPTEEAPRHAPATGERRRPMRARLAALAWVPRMAGAVLGVLALKVGSLGLTAKAALALTAVTALTAGAVATDVPRSVSDALNRRGPDTEQAEDAAPPDAAGAGTEPTRPDTAGRPGQEPGEDQPVGRRGSPDSADADAGASIEAAPVGDTADGVDSDGVAPGRDQGSVDAGGKHDRAPAGIDEHGTPRTGVDPDGGGRPPAVPGERPDRDPPAPEGTPAAQPRARAPVTPVSPAQRPPQQGARQDRQSPAAPVPEPRGGEGLGEPSAPPSIAVPGLSQHRR